MRIEPTPTLEIEKHLDIITLLTDSELQSLFQKISSEYLYWDKVKYMAPKGVDSRTLWQAVKIQRLLNAQTISFGKYNFRLLLQEKCNHYCMILI